MKVQYMKPFYTKVTGNKLRLVFAYQYLSLMENDDIFWFVPIENKEIIINLDNQQIENNYDVFVFQRSNRFKRMHLHQLLMIDGFREQLDEIINISTGKSSISFDSQDDSVPEDVAQDSIKLLDEILEFNIKNAIDMMLDNKDYDGIVRLRGWF